MGSVDAATGFHEVSETIMYECDSIVDFEMPITIKATVPEAVTPGEENYSKNSYTELTLPEEAMQGIRLLQADKIKGEVTKFEVISTNTEKTVNVAENNQILFPETEVPDEGLIEDVRVPAEGGVDAGPFVAGEEGEMTFHAGDIDTDLVAVGPLGESDLPASCSPKDGEDTTITTVKIDPDAVGEEDTEAPEISLNGDNPMELEVGDTYEEPGATAEDDVDGDVSDNIEISGDVDTSEPGEYTVTYTVSDEAGNEAMAERTVIVIESDEGDEDTEAPKITLNGDNPMELEVGDTYEEPGATAEDNVDGDVSDNIEISGADDIDTSEPGEYTVTYTVTDEAGNTVTEERTVIVVESGGTETPVEGQWYTGEGTPGADLGNEGDLYLDTETGDVYQKGSDGWGEEPIMNITGPKGDQGEPGEPGEDGDKGDTGDQGPIGESGSMWYTDEGAPDVDLGDEGDLYLNTDNDDVYQKTADGWKKIANLKGAQGPEGEPGDCDCDNGNGNGDNGNGTNDDEGGTLPTTASSTPLLILIGSLLAAGGGVLVFFRKKKLLN